MNRQVPIRAEPESLMLRRCLPRFGIDPHDKAANAFNLNEIARFRLLSRPRNVVNLLDVPTHQGCSGDEGGMSEK
jgi:hypothetical protein